MPRNSTRVLLLLSLLSIEVYAGVQIVPGVSNITERSIHLATGLRLHNRDTTAAAVTLRFVPFDDSVAVDPYVLTVAAGQTASYLNVLRQLWNLEEQKGTLEIESDGALLVRAHKYTDTIDKVSGVVLPAVAQSALIQVGATGDVVWLEQSGDADTGARSSVWIYLETKNAAGDLVLFDAAGLELARTTITGAPRSRQVFLADLVAAGVAPARAEWRVVKGRGLAYGEVSTGPQTDWMGLENLTLADQALDNTLLPMIRKSMPNDAWLVTDLRLFNPWNKESSARFFFRGQFIEVLLKPREVKDFPDVLSTLLGVNDEASTSVRLVFVPRPLYAVMRTRHRAADGTALAQGLYTSGGTTELFGPDGAFAIAGMPSGPGELLLFARGGAQGARADAVFEDGAGARSTPPLPTLALGASESRADSLNTQLGVSPPSGGVLSVLPTQGALDAGILSILQGSGDPAWHRSAVASAEACAAPVILSFVSSASTLAQPGPVRLNWTVVGADNVDLNPGGLTGLAGMGAAPVAIAEPSTYTLLASNACGAATATLQIAVGTPSLKTAVGGAASGSAAAGSPGQLMILTFDNLSEPQNIKTLIFRGSDGVEGIALPVGTDSNGRVLALVPFFPFPDVGRQYKMGEFQVSALTTEGKRSNAVPFRIDPLTPVADAVAGFRTLLDQTISEATASLRQVRTSETTALVDAQLKVIASTNADLRNLLAAIESKGSGEVIAAGQSRTDANSIRVTVNRNDLEDLLAYNQNAITANIALYGAPASSVAAKAGAGLLTRDAGTNPRDARTCLGDFNKAQLVPGCKAREVVKKYQAAFAANAAEFINQYAEVPPEAASTAREWVLKKLRSNPKYVSASKFNYILQIADIQCLIYPVELERFKVKTKKDTTDNPALTKIYTGNTIERSKSVPTPAEVIAVLVPEYTAQDVTKKAIAKEAAQIAAGLGAKGVAAQITQAAVAAFIEQSQGDLELKAIESAAQFLKIDRVAEYQVGKCDLINVYPKKNGSSNKAIKDSVVSLAVTRAQGEDDYWFLGLKALQNDDLCIIPNWDHFIPSPRVRAGLGKDDKCQSEFKAGNVQVNSRPPRTNAAAVDLPLVDTAAFSDEVAVGPGEDGVNVSLAWTGAGGIGEQIARPVNYPVVNIPVKDGVPFVQEKVGGLATSRVEVKKTGEKTWEITMLAVGELVPKPQFDDSGGFTAEAILDLRVHVTENREETQGIRMKANTSAQGPCKMSISLQSGSKISQGEQSASLEEKGIVSLNSSIAFVVQMYAYTGGSPGTTTCKGTGTIEILQ